MTKITYSTTDRRRLVREARKHMRGGDTLAEASRKVGVNPKTMWFWVNVSVNRPKGVNGARKKPANGEPKPVKKTGVSRLVEVVSVTYLCPHCGQSVEQVSTRTP